MTTAPRYLTTLPVPRETGKKGRQGIPRVWDWAVANSRRDTKCRRGRVSSKYIFLHKIEIKACVHLAVSEYSSAAVASDAHAKWYPSSKSSFSLNSMGDSGVGHTSDEYASLTYQSTSSLKNMPPGELFIFSLKRLHYYVTSHRRESIFTLTSLFQATLRRQVRQPMLMPGGYQMPSLPSV